MCTWNVEIDMFWNWCILVLTPALIHHSSVWTVLLACPDLRMPETTTIWSFAICIFGTFLDQKWRFLSHFVQKFTIFDSKSGIFLPKMMIFHQKWELRNDSNSCSWENAWVATGPWNHPRSQVFHMSPYVLSLCYCRLCRFGVMQFLICKPSNIFQFVFPWEHVCMTLTVVRHCYFNTNAKQKDYSPSSGKTQQSRRRNYLIAK